MDISIWLWLLWGLGSCTPIRLTQLHSNKPKQGQQGPHSIATRSSVHLHAHSQVFKGKVRPCAQFYVNRHRITILGCEFKVLLTTTITDGIHCKNRVFFSLSNQVQGRPCKISESRHVLRGAVHPAHAKHFIRSGQSFQHQSTTHPMLALLSIV